MRNQERDDQPAGFAPGWKDAAADASPWCSAALLAAITGALMAQGHDGLAYTLGLVGAAFLWASVLVPWMAARGPATTVPALLADQFQSRSVGALASAVLLLALLGLMAAEVTIAARASMAAALSVGGPALLIVVPALAAVVLRGSAALRLRIFALVATILVLLAALVELAAKDSWAGLPGAFVAIPAISDVAALEQGLLEKRMADAATFKPHTVPFLRTDMMNFASLIISLSLGLAVLAQLPVRRLEAGAAGGSGQLAARAGVIVIGCVLLVPPLAAAAKRALLSLFAGGLKPGALPDWMGLYRSTGGVELCGTTQGDAAALIRACGKGVGAQGWMRWHDAAFAPDALLFAGLETTPLGFVLVAAFAATAALACVWTARRAGALAGAALFSGAEGDEGVRPVMLTIVSLALAAGLAWLKPADAATLIAWSASLAAAALVPALIAGLVLARPSAPIALAAMAVGGGLALLLILGSRFAPLELFGWTGSLSTAPPTVVKKLATLHDTWASAADGPGKDALALQATKLARDSLNWFGVRPLAAGVLGLAGGAAFMFAGSLATAAGRRVLNTGD